MFWIGLTFLCVGIIINFIITEAHPGIYLGTLIACVGAMLITTARYETKPSAMDVYQGKTTLDITYRDGIPIDSVVVYKEK